MNNSQSDKVNKNRDAANESSLTRASFGRTSETNAEIDLYTIKNRNGVTLKVASYGGAIVSLSVPDRAGNFADVVLGYDDVAGYERDDSYFGSLIGRFANRIARGMFSLDGATYQLEINNLGNHLHGGSQGFHKVVWHAEEAIEADGAGVELTYVARDGESDYPGVLQVTVRYILNDSDELKIEYVATTDKPTIINLTNHSYFNLAGENSGATILNHQLEIAADRFTPIDATLIPTGELRAVKRTAFDFQIAKNIGADIESKDEQLSFGKGYDHNFVLSKPLTELGFAAEIYEPESGRAMRVLTTQPGLQFYSGNFLNAVKGKAASVYKFRQGLCLETQNFPDAPNHTNFPSPVLRPGERYARTTVYKFFVKD